MSKTAVILPNYNMFERANLMYEYFQDYVKTPHDFIMVDNGSDIMPPSKYSAIRTQKNLQTCQGWLLGLKYADLLTEGGRTEPYKYYLFTITSTQIVKQSTYPDILEPMVMFMEHNPNAIGLHASLTKNSTTAWTHLINRDTNKVRRTWFIDNIFALYRASWFNQIGRFDPDLTYAWGVDLETCWKARGQGRGIYVDDRVQVEKITNIGYKMNRMNMSASDRVNNAYNEAKGILQKRYGHGWESKLREEFVDAKWR